jgi:predicted aconitase with swiveling domain
MEKRLKGRALVAGQAAGLAVVSSQPISFWGGVSPRTGDIIDQRHERCGTNLTGKIFVFPVGKGSSTGSAVLMEGIRNGTAPAAIVNKKVDSILALGAIVAQELYQRTIPVIVLDELDFQLIHEGDQLKIEPDGTIILSSRENSSF